VALKLIFLLYSGACNRQQSELRAYDPFGFSCPRAGLNGYRLSFLDETGHVRELCKSDFETDCTAILWMQVVGAERAQHSGWSMMELRCRQRCVARVQAQVLRRAWKSSLRFA